MTAHSRVDGHPAHWDEDAEKWIPDDTSLYILCKALTDPENQPHQWAGDPGAVLTAFLVALWETRNDILAAVAFDASKGVHSADCWDNADERTKEQFRTIVSAVRGAKVP